MLTIGTAIRRLNHLGYPAFEKMNQNGMMIKTTKIRQMISPYIGIISDMAFLPRMVLGTYLPRVGLTFPSKPLNDRGG